MCVRVRLDSVAFEEGFELGWVLVLEHHLVLQLACASHHTRTAQPS